MDGVTWISGTGGGSVPDAMISRILVTILGIEVPPVVCDTCWAWPHASHHDDYDGIFWKTMSSMSVPIIVKFLWCCDNEVQKTLVCRHVYALNKVEVVDDLLHLVVCVTDYLRWTVHITANVETSWESCDLIKAISKVVKKSR